MIVRFLQLTSLFYQQHPLLTTSRNRNINHCRNNISSCESKLNRINNRICELEAALSLLEIKMDSAKQEDRNFHPYIIT